MAQLIARGSARAATAADEQLPSLSGAMAALQGPVSIVDLVVQEAGHARLATRTLKSGCKKSVGYSARNDSTGSSFDARRAGSTPAASPIRAASTTASTA